MKRVFSIVIAGLFACIVCAQTHIEVSDPATWSAQSLAPYVGQTVIFDVPLVVNSNYNTLLVSTRRLFSPTNQAYPGSAAYSNIVSLNSSGTVTLEGVSGYHRCGEKIYNLKARVNSTTNISFISGEWRGNTRADLEKGLPDLGDYRLLICTMKKRSPITS